MKLKIFSLITAIMLLTVSFIPAAGATTLARDRITMSVEFFQLPDSEILGVSSKGEWDNFPENSVPALIEAAKTEKKVQ